VLFRWLIHRFSALFFDGGASLLSSLGPWYIVLIPAAGGLIVGLLVYYLAPETKGHGVPEVMYAVDREGGRIRIRVAVIKALASSVCIGSGGSVGREGPIVQIGSSLGSTLGQLFHLSRDKVKILVACGAGGGIAATFNAPLAGIFFALEIILRSYAPRHISSVVLASVLATVVSRNYLGDNPAFTVPHYQMNSPWEILFYLFFGFLAAAVAWLFITTLYKSEDIFDKLPLPGFLKPALGGLIIGIIGLYYPQIFGVGYKSIELALYGKITAGLGLILVFAKLVATSVTLGSGGSGGVFAPSLFLGAMLGVVFSKLTLLLFPSVAINPGASAMIGMAAVFAGAAQAPISSILILFEMTGDYKIILPLMTAVVIATLVLRKWSRESIYTKKLARRGIDTTQGPPPDLLEIIQVSEAMTRNVITLQEEQTIKEAGLTIKKTRHRGFPVLNEEGKLAGIVTHKDINKALAAGQAERPVREIMTTDVVVSYPDECLRKALEKLGSRNIGRAPVVDPSHPGKVLGLITRKNILKAMHDHLNDE
jgi:CIC family chloride channel protein